MPDRVWIFDTTLRDGEQSPGASMSPAEKLEVARALALLGVDIIEAGFPAASPGDLKAVKTIAEVVGTKALAGREAPIIAGLARASRADIDATWEAVRPAARPRIHTFLATSDLHLQHKLRMSRAEVLEAVRMSVRYAKSLCADIEFSAEDASRSDPEFLVEVFTEAARAGATTLNVPDTVGYATPEEYFSLISMLRQRVPGEPIFSVHCHDDLGLATANTLAGLRAGARQAEVAVNGIGERAGNCALEEVVMALRTRPQYGFNTNIDSAQLTRVSRLVSTCTGMAVQANKAIVGANAFSHESGIHQDGVLKHEQTYEIMRPETVGATNARIVLGKHSGRHAFAVRLRELGYELEGRDLDDAFARFKELGDKKRVISDADLESLVASELSEAGAFQLDGLQVGCGTAALPTATVKLRGADGTVHVQASVGTGPVDACFKAVDEIVKTHATLIEYRVHAVTEGIDALGEVSVKLRGQNGTAAHPQRETQSPVFHGHGADTDIIVASVKAYLAALNRYLSTTEATTEVTEATTQSQS
jgi:2-isopropylmalate synthase